jgi:hypothetical protein
LGDNYNKEKESFGQSKSRKTPSEAPEYFLQSVRKKFFLTSFTKGGDIRRKSALFLMHKNSQVKE